MSDALRHCLGCLALLLAVGPTAARCPPADWPASALNALKAQQWKLADALARERLAIELLDCLPSPDPVLRDDIAFGALQAWLRAGVLGAPRARQIGLMAMAGMGQVDVDGFGPPFAALVLSEVVRVDRMQALWTPAERQAVVQFAAAWVAAVRDYRGFEPVVGWRHAVAHGADLLMQLALNPALDKAQLDVVLGAVESQVMPASGHSYVHGESERLMRPVLFAARRGLHSGAEWTSWLGRLAATATPTDDAPTTTLALARVHNLKGFLNPLYAAVMEGSDTALRERLRPGLVAALRALP